MNATATPVISPPAAALAQYSTTAKVFHWVTAVAFLAQFPIGFTMVQMSAGSTASFLFSLHESLGFLILWLALLRLFNRFRSPVVRKNSRLARWHIRASIAAHYTIYALLILVPLTGWMGVSAYNSLELFGTFSLPAILPPDQARAVWILWTHGLLAFSLMALVAVHVGFAMQGYLDGPDDDSTAGSPENSPASAR